MFINTFKRRDERGLTLVELMIAMGLFSVVSMALMTIFIFCLKSFQSMSNYSTLDRENRVVVDLMTRDIRQASYVADFSEKPPSITLVNGGIKITYAFDEDAQTLSRVTSDGDHRVLLRNCTDLTFRLFQRNAVGGSYDVFPVAEGDWKNSAKVIESSWKTSRNLGGVSPVNTEYVQTARIVIRKKSS